MRVLATTSIAHAMPIALSMAYAHRVAAWLLRLQASDFDRIAHQDTSAPARPWFGRAVVVDAWLLRTISMGAYPQRSLGRTTF